MVSRILYLKKEFHLELEMVSPPLLLLPFEYFVETNCYEANEWMRVKV